MGGYITNNKREEDGDGHHYDETKVHQSNGVNDVNLCCRTVINDGEQFVHIMFHAVGKKGADNDRLSDAVNVDNIITRTIMMNMETRIIGKLNQND